MISELRKTFLLLIFLFPVLLQAQEMISGSVFSAKDSTALEGVSVYFDGTSVGTVTGNTGAFKIEKDRSGLAPLVISFLGFKNLVLPVSEDTTEFPAIYLQEKEEMLAEVIIEPDTWSRAKKLRIFRQEFLGNSPEAADCKIKNEDAIKLYFFPSKNVLSAEFSEPLEIVNKHLGYHISYDLSLFRVEFLDPPGSFRGRKMVFFEGTSFFDELNDRIRRRHEKHREMEYKGSSLHFMRALAAHELEENRFRIFHESFETDPYKFFDLSRENGITKVKLLTEKLTILYSDLYQSAIETQSEFSIDQLGNHTPPLAVIFSGDMSVKRVANMLPLNYFPEEDKDKL
ncbi:MAG: carboxypeptidase-like regulatory domain-containing protein [Salinimicrobium sp.]